MYIVSGRGKTLLEHISFAIDIDAMAFTYHFHPPTLKIRETKDKAVRTYFKVVCLRSQNESRSVDDAERTHVNVNENGKGFR